MMLSSPIARGSRGISFSTLLPKSTFQLAEFLLKDHLGKHLAVILQELKMEMECSTEAGLSQ